MVKSLMVDTRFYCLPPNVTPTSDVYNYSYLSKEKLEKLELKGFYPIITVKIFSGQMNYSPLEDILDYYGDRVYGIAYEITADKLEDSTRYQLKSFIRAAYNKQNLSSHVNVPNRSFQIQFISNNQEKLIDYENELAFNKNLENAVEIAKKFNKDKDSVLSVLYPTNTNWKIMKDLIDNSNKQVLSETSNGLLKLIDFFGMKELSSLVALNTANALSKSKYNIVPVFSSLSKRLDYYAGNLYLLNEEIKNRIESTKVLELLGYNAPLKTKRRVSWKTVPSQIIRTGRAWKDGRF